MPIRIELLDPRADPRYAAERELRYQVLRAPLGLSRAQVGFTGEEDALHVIALDGDAGEALVGCVLFDFQSGRLRAMAVSPARQRQGVGALLVKRLEQEVLQRGVRTITLHARAQAASFYARLGYAVAGEPFLEVSLPHVQMVKSL